MSSCKFPKTNRLLSKEDFSYLKSDSKCEKSKGLMAFYKTNKDQSSDSRVGFSVSKKVGNAVKRNLLKRHLRECFRTSEFKSLGKDVLFVVHPKFFNLIQSDDPSKVLEKSMNAIFSRIRVNG